MAETALQELLDEAACRRVLMRYGPAVDWKDRTTLERLFWPDAVVDLGVFKGDGASTPAFLVANAERSLRRCHITTNVSLRLDGRLAHAESCALTHAITATDAEGPGGERLAHLFIGRYLDRLERRGAEWRLSERRYLLHGATTTSYADAPALEAMAKADDLGPLHPLFTALSLETP